MMRRLLERWADWEMRRYCALLEWQLLRRITHKGMRISDVGPHVHVHACADHARGWRARWGMRLIRWGCALAGFEHDSTTEEVR